MNGSWNPSVSSTTRSRTRRNNFTQFQPGLFDVLEKSGRIWAVAPIPVLRQRSAARGISHQDTARLERGQSAADRPRCRGARHLRHEGIVPAGIDQHQLQTRRVGNRIHDDVEANGLELNIAVAFQGGIHRDQIVGVLDFDPMTGEIDKRNVSTSGGLAEVAQGDAHAVVVKVNSDRDLESDPGQRFRNVLRVIGRIGQARDMLVGGIADDQGYALLRLRNGGG